METNIISDSMETINMVWACQENGAYKMAQENIRMDTFRKKKKGKAEEKLKGLCERSNKILKLSGRYMQR